MRTIEGYEAMHAIRKGQIRWLRKRMPSARASSFTRPSGSQHNQSPPANEQPIFARPLLFATGPLRPMRHRHYCKHVDPLPGTEVLTSSHRVYP